MAQTTEKMRLRAGAKRRRPDPFDGDQAAPIREARFLKLALVAGALVLFGLGTLMTIRNAAPETRGASPETRQALYLRALEELATICRQPTAASRGVGAHCVAQARLVLGYPECGERCTQLARLILPGSPPR
jgi:hypothetical protein